jgi:glycosyltransferase involved in cell wall biosynthesis
MELVTELGLEDKTFFVGRVTDEDLLELYVGAQCHVHPALYEGFGLPPLEAMACGTPTIVSNVSSLPEVVSDAALLVNPEDHEEIAVAINRLLTNTELHAELRRKGLRQAEYFSWDKAARATLDVYRKVVDPGPSKGRTLEPSKSSVS